MRAVISGYFGYGNAGDEAVLAAITAQLRALAPGIRILALSGNPEATTRLHGIEAVNRYRVADVIRAIRGAGLFISGGGSLFQDVTSWRSPAYYAAVIGLARALGVPVFFYAQGVGPLNSRWGKRLTGWAANRAERVTVRDYDSMRLLQVIGVKRPIEVTADPAFALQPVWTSRAEEVWRRAGVGDEHIIAFALRPWIGLERYLGDIAAAIHRLEVKDGFRVVLVPMRVGQDDILAEKIVSIAQAGTVLGVSQLTPAELAGLFGRFSLVVAMRLHSLILGAAQVIPSVAVEYDPKVAAGARMLPGSPLLQISALTSWGLYDEIIKVWQQRAQIQQAMRLQVENLRRLAGETARMALMVGKWS